MIFITNLTIIQSSKQTNLWLHLRRQMNAHRININTKHGGLVKFVSAQFSLRSGENRVLYLLRAQKAAFCLACICHAKWASNSRCTQCWNTLEKHIQRPDGALAPVSTARWAWRQLSDLPLAPTVTIQKRSLFTVRGQLPAPLTSIRQPPAKGHLYMSLFN